MSDWTLCNCGHLGVMHAKDGHCAAHIWGAACDCPAFEVTE